MSTELVPYLNPRPIWIGGINHLQQIPRPRGWYAVQPMIARDGSLRFERYDMVGRDFMVCKTVQGLPLCSGTQRTSVLV